LAKKIGAEHEDIGADEKDGVEGRDLSRESV
jgi:hypothetical protein